MTPTSHGKRITFRAADRARKAIDAAMALSDDDLGRIFTEFDAFRIASDAKALDADAARRAGPLSGITVSIKDLFDEAGIVTTAGSMVLASEKPASRDAEAVARLKAAGALACGRTTMSEFAYSGVGLNPHFGNPRNARDGSRIAGGSTSGGALSVAHGIVDVALGSDTGGSVRIPAALNGLAGFKPTQTAVPLDGAFPLSGSYDSIGPLARDIATCAAVHAVLSASEPGAGLTRKPCLAVARGPLLEGLDAQVAADFERAIDRLSKAGFEIVDITLPGLEDFGRANRIIVASEAHAVHRARLDTLETQGDGRVLKRIRAAEAFADGEETEMRAMREAGIEEFRKAAADVDAFLAPTLPTVAPTTSDTEADFDRLNALMLRNPSSVNFLDGCAATIPMQGEQTLATGLMMFAPGGCDWSLLAIARQAEATLSSHTI